MADKLTPWEAEGSFSEHDYENLIKQFGTKRLDSSITSKMKKVPLLVRRGWYYSHRDMDKFLEAFNTNKKVSLVTGRGPSDRMHIGHIIPLLLAKDLQKQYGAKLWMPVSDDEKFYVKPKLGFKTAEEMAENNMRHMIAMGFDPKKTVIFRDFEYTKIYKYAAQIAKHVTYSTAKAVFGLVPEQNIGWSFYPAVQSAHILLPQFLEGAHNTLVPIAIDQDPYMRILRDVAEHQDFKFIKPGAVHSKFLPGLEGPGTKMSSSKPESAIFLDDDEKTVEKKVKKYAFSGGRDTIEEHRKHGGNPEVDASYIWLTVFEEDDKKVKKVHDEYKSGKLLSGELKMILIESLNKFLKDHQNCGNTVGVRFDVENIGGSAAHHTCAQVFGQPWAVRPEYSSDATAWFGLGTNGDDGCEDGGSMAPKNKDGLSRVDSEFDISDVRNPNTAVETQDLFVRVWSKYTTNATARLEALSSNEAKVRQSQGGITKKPIVSTSTDGPVHITIIADEPQTITTDKKISLRINLKNVGGGLVFNPGKATGKAGYDEVTSTDYGRVVIDEVVVGAGSTEWTPGEGCGVGSPLKVPDGTDGLTKTCTFTINEASVPPINDLSIFVSVSYGYRMQYSTTVDIKQNQE